MKIVFDLIIQTLKEADIAPVYALGAHKGVIDEGTIVVKPASATQFMNFSTTIQYFDILCYGRTISETVDVFEKVKQAMKSLEMTVMPTFLTSTPFYESNVKGWQIVSTYRNYVKN